MQKNNSIAFTLIIYLTAMVLLSGLQISASLGAFENLPETVTEIIGSVGPQIIIMFLVPFVMLLCRQKSQKQPLSLKAVSETVGWRRLSWKNLLLVLVLGLCLYIINIFVAGLFATMLRMFGYQYPNYPHTFHGVSGLFITLGLSAVLPAFCEEFLHRGVLMRGLLPKFGVMRAVLWTSLFFALMHMNAGQFFYTFVLGWFMAVAVLATQSLWAGVIIHFVNNALSTYMGYTDELTLPLAGIFEQTLNNAMLSLLLLVLAVVLVGAILRVLAKTSFDKNLDLYTVRYLAAQKEFDHSKFDEVKTTLPKAIAAMPAWKATFAYIETFTVPQKTQPLERALLVAIILLGSIISCLSLVWGTW